MSVLKEILNMMPLDSVWIDDTRCVFVHSDQQYGIQLDEFTIELPNRKLSVVNVCFGRIKHKNFTASQLDTTLTGLNEPRKILSTVAHALQNSSVLNDADLITIASSDQHRNKRFTLYSLALQQLQKQNSQLLGYQIERIELSGSKIVILCATVLSDDEKEFLKMNLNLIKA